MAASMFIHLSTLSVSAKMAKTMNGISLKQGHDLSPSIDTVCILLNDKFAIN